MVHKRKYRYSFLLTPLAVFIDILIIFLIFLYFQETSGRDIINLKWFFGYTIAAWALLSMVTQYYFFPRYITLNELLSNFFTHILIFDLAVLAGMELFKISIPNITILFYLGLLNFILLAKIILHFILLKRYRARGFNFRRYVIFGYNDELEDFKDLLDKRRDYGYRFVGFFANSKGVNGRIKGDFNEGLKYLADKNNDVDVIFASLRHDDEQLMKLVFLAEEHFLELKFIPDNREFFKNKLILEYIETYPVLTLAKSPLDKPVNAFIKRSFDIIFSLLIIVFILSWLTPILGLLIKIESKGPIFFKQKRNGEFYKPFYLYKFRSMRLNPEADLKQVSKNDNRVTRLGRFIRKTSIDELPQFFNVLAGDMSVVGPRPHMIKENEKFLQQVSKFLFRHQVKPGITGLAQVKGFRGEVITKEDIEGRVKWDIYYIKNWSFLLDIKIIIMTLLKVLKGDKKAY